MKKFKDFLAEIETYKEALGDPTIPAKDKGLDDFNALSSQVVMQLRNIQDPNLRNKLQPLVNSFYSGVERAIQQQTKANPAVGVQANLGQVHNNPSTIQMKQTASSLNPTN